MKFEFMPRYTKYLCWYRTEIEKDRGYGYLSIFIIMVVLALAGLYKCESNYQPIYTCHYSKEELKLASIFAQHGSPNPFEMAIAVRKTKNPPLMAAIAIKESNASPKAIGDGGDSKGAFQVQEKHWGKVSNTATEQALQAEKILQELVQSSRGKLRYGLAKYNGGVRPPAISYRYAVSIIKLSRIIRKDIKNG